MVLLEGADAARDLGLEPVRGPAQTGDLVAQGGVGEAVDVLGGSQVETFVELIDCGGRRRVGREHLYGVSA
jgi:hypothetical protein